MSTESNPGEKKKYDNFYSPVNHTFYASQQYCQLDKDRKEIRLIKLLPGTKDDQIVCQLVDNVPIDTVSGQYQALSYCAGDHRQTQEISVNGVAFNVFKTLGEAMVRVREEALPSKEDKILVWTDQICINQSDHAERASQVLLMRDVYQKASRVVAWLGTSPAGNALGFFKDMLESIETLVLDIMLQREEGEEEDKIVVDDHGHYVPVFEQAVSILAPTLLSNADDEDFHKSWRSIKTFFDLPYWKRGWIRQEIVVAKSVVLMLDNGSIKWEEFHLVRQLISRTSRYLLSEMLDGADLTKFDFEAMLAQGESKQKSLWKMMNEFGYMDLDDMGAILTLQENFQENKATDLKTILELARRCKVTDPKDRIYAFLGLTDPGYKIVPDYSPSNNFSRLLCSVAERIITYEQSLDILSYAQGRERALDEDLPSWVPDWSSRGPANYVQQHWTKFKASGDLEPSFAFCDNLNLKFGSTIRLLSIVVDCLAQEDSLLSGNKRNREGARETWTVLLEDHKRDTAATSELMKKILWRGQGEALASKEVEEQDKTGRVREQNKRISSHRQVLENESLEGLWKFFVSPKGHVGLAPHGALHTDFIAIIPGANVPYIIRKVDDHYLLIGEAYVHGLMFGEVIGLVEEGKVDIELVELW